MIWGLALVVILSGIIIIVFRCMDFPENEYSEMELATEREIKQERKEKFLKLFNMDTENQKMKWMIFLTNLVLNLKMISYKW